MRIGSANCRHIVLAYAALREATRRRVLRGFDVRRDIDGTPEEVREGRERL